MHVTFDGSDGDPQVMSAIAATVDTALASGKYDPLFVQIEVRRLTGDQEIRRQDILLIS